MAMLQVLAETGWSMRAIAIIHALMHKMKHVEVPTAISLASMRMVRQVKYLLKAILV